MFVNSLSEFSLLFMDLTNIKSKAILEIKNIAVYPEFQGKGYGKKLIDFINILSKILKKHMKIIGKKL